MTADILKNHFSGPFRKMNLINANLTIYATHNKFHFCIPNNDRSNNMYNANIRQSISTFLSKSTSSDLAFFSYPGGGNGKQRDIVQNPDMPSVFSLQN